MREYESEPVPGLPENLPEGEHILWQGRPKWTALVMRAFHIRAVAIYFALLGVWFARAAYLEGASNREVAEAFAAVLPGAAIALALLAALAYVTARVALYTITNRRVVMRFGIALPMVLNIPFKQIRSADFRPHHDDTGDIPLSVNAPKRQSMIVLWPHVRPWRTTEPEPMLRCVPDARRVADVLANALHAASPEASVAVVSDPSPINDDGHIIGEPAAA